MFNTPLWRTAVIAGLGVVAFYKFAPAPSDETLIAKYVSRTMTSGEVWKDILFKHLLLSAQGSDETLLITDAKPPVVHRYRFPQYVSLMLGGSSGHCHGLCEADMFLFLPIIGDLTCTPRTLCQWACTSTPATLL